MTIKLKNNPPQKLLQYKNDSINPPQQELKLYRNKCGRLTELLTV